MPVISSRGSSQVPLVIITSYKARSTSRLCINAALARKVKLETGARVLVELKGADKDKERELVLHLTKETVVDGDRTFALSKDGGGNTSAARIAQVPGAVFHKFAGSYAPKLAPGKITVILSSP